MSDDRLDAELRAADLAPPPMRPGLEEDVLAHFRAQVGGARRSGHPRLVSTLAWAAGMVIGGSLLFALWPREEAPPSRPEGPPAEVGLTDEEAESLRDWRHIQRVLERTRAERQRVELASLLERLDRANQLLGSVEVVTLEPVDESVDDPRRAQLADVDRSDQLGLLRLAALDRTHADVTGVAELARRYRELAGHYSGSTIARLAEERALALENDG